MVWNLFNLLQQSLLVVAEEDYLFRESGGFLGKKSGEVIGVVTQSIKNPSEKVVVQQLNFAIPINTINRVLKGEEKRFTEESPDYFYSLGMLSKNKKEYDKAIDYFKKCIDIDNSYVDAYVDLGDAYYEKGLYDEELQILRKVILLDPNNSDAYYSLAMAYEDKGLYESAISAYRKVLEIKQNDKDAIYSLGILYIAQGEKNKALKLIPKLLELNPGLGTLLRTLVNRAQ
jgi:tetratricopeptide (TPR) repeat protein